MTEKKRTRDTTTTIVASLFIGILIGWLVTGNMEQEWLWLAVFSVLGGWVVSQAIVLVVQQQKAGTNQSLKQNWQSVLKSWCFYLCPAATLLTALILKWV